MKIEVYIYLIIVIFFNSCKKEDLPSPVKPTECWEKFVGDYIVYDTAAGISFPMTIEQYKDTNAGGYYTDFLAFKNFDNQFNLYQPFTCYTPSNYIEIGYNVNCSNQLGNHTCQQYHQVVFYR